MEKRIRAAAGTILYRWPSEGGIEILMGERRKDPEYGRTVVAFSGLIQPGDESVPHAALREAYEETGRSLGIRITHYVKTYGPHIFRHMLYRKDSSLVAQNTGEEIDLPDRFVLNVYAGLVVFGSPHDNSEIQGLRWVNPENTEYLKAGLRCYAFEQALILADFWHKHLYDQTFCSPCILTAIHAPVV